MGSIKESKKEKSSKENVPEVAPVAPAEESVASTTATPATKDTAQTGTNGTSTEPAKDLASTPRASEKGKEIPTKGPCESEEDSYIKAKKSDEIFEPVIGKEMNLAPPYMYVNVKSYMAGLEETRIRVMFLHETVYELKQKIYLKNKVLPEKQVLVFNKKELAENNKKLTDCGVIPESIILMNVRMISGQTQRRIVEEKKKTETPKCTEKDMEKIEEVKRSIEERKRKMKKETEEEKKTNETVSRDVETTREKMKKLVTKEKGKRILSTSSISRLKPSSSTISKKTTAISANSNPLEYLRKLRSKGSQKKKRNKLLKKPVTEEELKHFFETNETLEELKKNRENAFMVPPPQNVEELEFLKKHFQDLRKTRCGECKEKLAEEEQSVHCNCGKKLCTGHRKKHNCEGHRAQKSKKMRMKKKKKKKTVVSY